MLRDRWLHELLHSPGSPGIPWLDLGSVGERCFSALSFLESKWGRCYGSPGVFFASGLDHAIIITGNPCYQQE
jgi:hypothetical protein